MVRVNEMGILKLFQEKKAASVYNRDVVIATMHGKEKAIKPVLADFKSNWQNLDSFNSDQFGTFSGEVPRKANVLETCIAKAKLAISLSGAEVAIASEGSFGPHPSHPWIPCNTELLVWYDAKANLIVRETAISIETNFASKWVKTKDELFDFAKRASFPSHGLILRTTSDSNQKYSPLYKGIVNYDELEFCFDLCLEKSETGSVLIETDMRANMNPTRMDSIGKVTEKLKNRLIQECPECDVPGFGLIHGEMGLPCSSCGLPTELIKTEIWGCTCCNHTQRKPRKDGLKSATPGECSICNP